MGRLARGVTVLSVAALLVASAASAASPDRIYRDFQEDGRLDGRYSIADLQAALRNPALQVYRERNPTVVPEIRREIRRKIREEQPLRTARRTPGLPFTGFDLALLTFGGGLLLAVGLTLRRVARAKR